MSAAEDEVFAKVLRIVAESLRVPAGGIARDKPFPDQGIESLETLNILFAVEEGFSIRIDAQPGDIRTLDELAERVRGELSKAPAGGAAPAEA